MTARIFFKLIFAVLLIMVVALTTVDFLASEMAEQAYIQGLTLELQEKVKMLGVLGRQDILKLTGENVQAMSAAAGGRLTVIAPDGRVLLDSEADPAKMENHGDRPEVRTALAGQLGTSIRQSPTLGLNFLYVAGPIKEGAARLAMPLRQVRSQVTEIRRKLLLYMALAFLPGILLAGFFARYFSTRLGAIIDYASTLATGKFDARLERVGNDELGTLGRQLNETGERTSSSMSAMSCAPRWPPFRATPRLSWTARFTTPTTTSGSCTSSARTRNAWGGSPPIC